VRALLIPDMCTYVENKQKKGKERNCEQVLDLPEAKDVASFLRTFRQELVVTRMHELSSPEMQKKNKITESFFLFQNAI
jgi:hypothetical protein